MPLRGRSKVKGTFPQHHYSQLIFIQSHFLLHFKEECHRCVLEALKGDNLAPSISQTKEDKRPEQLTERHLRETQQGV
jgi:hypothetical protein